MGRLRYSHVSHYYYYYYFCCCCCCCYNRGYCIIISVSVSVCILMYTQLVHSACTLSLYTWYIHSVCTCAIDHIKGVLYIVVFGHNVQLCVFNTLYCIRLALELSLSLSLSLSLCFSAYINASYTTVCEINDIAKIGR